MFEKLKRVVADRVEAANEMRSHPGPADLAALPTGTASIGGLGSVPVAAASSYLGIEIQTIRPLDRLGAESSGLLGDAMRRRLRENGVGDPSLAPGEIVPGENDARIARLRARGMGDAQIAAMQQRIAEVTAEHEGTGWTIDLVNGNHASVQVFDVGAEGSGFDTMRTTYEIQHTHAGARSMQQHPTEFAVDRFDDSPYESYGLPGRAVARGRAHEVMVQSSHLGTLDLARTLAGIGALALHALEG